MNILLIIAGLLLILAGANYMTDGSAALAKRFSISEFVIGLTVVAVGTSAPELVVSVMSALKGSGAMAIGNVVGSNIFNTYVILGICAAFIPIHLTRKNMRIDIPMGILVSTILLLVCLGGTIHRIYGVVMLLIYIAIILFSIKSSRAQGVQAPQVPQEDASGIKSMPLWLALALTLGGLGALIYGGNIFLEGAVNLAREFNISDNVIAITLLAGGTSLPELAASVVSIIKGKSDIALGNVIGSNIANILLVLGASSIITPLEMGTITLSDILVVLGGSALLYLMGYILVRNVISKIEGAIMIAAYAVYIYLLLA
ncbi:MAG: calcium/sodium antiporter [Rikenellaceae bacterium]